MIIALLYLLSTLIAPAPLVSMTVETYAYTNRIDVVVHLLSSDARYTEYAVAVDGIETPVHAPLSALQTVTTTLPLTLPPICNTQAAISLVVTARVLTDTLAFMRRGIGVLVQRPCPLRLYIP